jgi:RimJ/RimL family protein N-acetyltransferase
MMKALEFYSDRLYIRPVESRDSASLFRYRSDPVSCKFLSRIPETVEDMAAFIAGTSAEINVPGTWFQFILIEHNSDTIIGDIGVHFLETDSSNKQAEIGYTLDKNFRGKGFASEALTVIINYLIVDLKKHRIIASINPANKDSIRLVERFGFRKEAHFKEGFFFRGEWVDDLLFALLAREWMNQRN